MGWTRIADDFWHLWDFPNCIGAIDGKHVVIQAPPNEGSAFFNYKGTHSVILLALCDANYRFIMVDVGECGSWSDGGVFRECEMGKKLKCGGLSIPGYRELPNSHVKMPFVVVGDAAFPLMENVMRPYPGTNLPLLHKVFNYRLSRARRIAENTFGILTTRWRILRQPIQASLKTINAVIWATVCLHNFLRVCDLDERARPYCPRGYVDYEDTNGKVHKGQWRKDGALNSVGRQGSNMYTTNARQVRNTFANFSVQRLVR